ncbi:MAG: hypothetical protein AAGH90_10995 [Pseudomonadota bacterium]
MSNPLKDWLRANDETRTAFAQRIGVSEQSLTRLWNGSHDFSTAMIRKVSAGTKGAVSEEALYEAWLIARRSRASGNDDMGVSCVS